MTEPEPRRPLTAADEQEVRDAVRAVMTAETMTMAAVARVAGIAYGTFSAWLGGTYAGRTEKVAEQAQRWLATRETQKRTKALAPQSPGFLLTPSAEAYFGVLEHAQVWPDLVVISGGAGVGKTTACDAYIARTPNVWKVTGEPCFSSPRLLLDSLCEVLGLTEKYSSQRISREIVRRLRNGGGLIIVDEAQHFSSHSLDQLRTIHDLAEVGVALVGNETVYSRLEGAVRSPALAQLFSRVGMRVARPRPAKGDIEALLDGWKVTGEAERKLLHVIGRKPGALRGMTKTLRMAHMMASAEDAPAPTAEHIQMAWSRVSNNSDLSDDRRAA